MSPIAPIALRRGLFCALFFSGTVLAADEPTPGQVQDVIRQQPPTSPLPVDPPPELRSDTPRPATESIGPAVLVESFIITGNVEISNDELQAALAPWVGQRLTLDRIYAAADHLTGVYRERGFDLAQVVVPAQKISDGSIELQVIEGRIGAISVSGNEMYSFDFLKRRLSALEPGKIYQRDAMERGILLLNDLPGLQARAVITPGEAFGTSDIRFRLEEDRYEFSTSVDNYGREELGEIRFLADAQINSLTGRGDQLYLGILYTEDGLLKYGNVTYGFPTGANGSRMRLTANRADYEVGGVFDILGITGDNTTYRADWSYPLLRSRSRNSVLTFAAQRFETESFDGAQDNSTELDLIELGFFMNGITARNHSWSLSTIIDGNGKSQGATLETMTSDAQQAKLRLDGSYSLPFAKRWLFATRATYVYSAEPLVDSQKFSLGGPYSVRGYAPAEQRGDAGAFVSLEVRRYFTVKGMPLAWPFFIDGGMARSQLSIDERAADPILEGELASAGTGLLFSPDGGTFSGALIYATPIDNHSPALGEKDNSRVWATFTYRF